MTSDRAALIAAVRELESDALLEIVETLETLATNVKARGGNSVAAVEWVIEQLTEAGE